MNLEEYDVMYRQEQAYWWYVSRTELLHYYMRDVVRLPPTPKIVDLGCGTGANLEVLAQYGTALGLDFSPEALSFCRKRALPRLMRANGEALALANASVDLFTAMDSLEHIPDDLAALREIHRSLKPGGTLLVTVPAFGFLWSEHDEALQHLRRYSAPELRNKLKAAGFELSRVTHVLFFLFPVVLAMRILQNFTKSSVVPRTSITMLPSLVNAVLLAINRLEMWLLRFLSFPVGVTIVAVARKSGVRSPESGGF
jgi:SAM-dependent methyltransferase